MYGNLVFDKDTGGGASKCISRVFFYGFNQGKTMPVYRICLFAIMFLLKIFVFTSRCVVIFWRKFLILRVIIVSHFAISVSNNCIFVRCSYDLIIVLLISYMCIKHNPLQLTPDKNICNDILAYWCIWETRQQALMIKGNGVGTPNLVIQLLCNRSFIYLIFIVRITRIAYEYRHTAHTIVSWPNPKQWVIIHASDLMMIIRQRIYIHIYIYSLNHQEKWVNWKHTAPHIV